MKAALDGHEKRAVFFDVGGTVVHGLRGRGEIVREALSSLGHERDADAVARAFHALDSKHAGRVYPDSRDRSASGPFWSGYNEDLLALLDLPHTPEADAAINAAFDSYEGANPERNYSIFPDTMPCISALRAAGLKVAAISNADDRLPRILSATGLADAFDFVLNSWEVKIAKPDPRIFRMALDRAGVRPEEAVHVGDLFLFDVVGALSAGIAPVLVDRRGRPPMPGEDRGRCGVVRSLAELPPMLGVS